MRYLAAVEANKDWALSQKRFQRHWGPILITNFEVRETGADLDGSRRVKVSLMLRCSVFDDLGEMWRSKLKVKVRVEF